MKVSRGVDVSTVEGGALTGAICRDGLVQNDAGVSQAKCAPLATVDGWVNQDRRVAIVAISSAVAAEHQRTLSSDVDGRPAVQADKFVNCDTRSNCHHFSFNCPQFLFDVTSARVFGVGTDLVPR